MGINAISYGGFSVYLVALREGIAGVHRLASDWRCHALP